MQVNLTLAEIETIAAALHAVSPSGGGSHQFTLARRFSALAPDSADTIETLATDFVAIVAAELVAE